MLGLLQGRSARVGLRTTATVLGRRTPAAQDAGAAPLVGPRLSAQWAPAFQPSGPPHITPARESRGDIPAGCNRQSDGQSWRCILSGS